MLIENTVRKISIKNMNITGIFKKRIGIDWDGDQKTVKNELAMSSIIPMIKKGKNFLLCFMILDYQILSFL